MNSCSSCGRPLPSQSDILYTADARIVCSGCYAKADIVETDKRAANNIRNAAWTSLLAGVLSWFAPLAGMIALGFAIAIALTSGVFAMQSMARGNERFTKHLTNVQTSLVWVTSVIGVALAGLMALAWLGAFRMVLTR